MVQPAAMFRKPLEIREVTPASVTVRLSYRLSQIVGSGRRWSYHDLAARSGIDVRTLKAYVQGTACPNLVKYKRLLAVLGPEIGTELNIMKGWLPRSDEIPPEAVNLVELREDLERARDVVAEMLGHDPQPHETCGGSETSAVIRLSFLGDDGQDDPVQPIYGDTPPEFRASLRIDQIDTGAVALRLSHRLRLMIGPGRRWRIGEVSEKTGIDRRTLQSYLDGTACPNLARYLRLGYLMGPEIGVELARMIGWEPRYAPAVRLRTVEVKRLLGAICETQAAIAAILGNTPPADGPARFIRRGDRLADGPVREMTRRVTR
jgi:transcriptional regulator with XRE-family HTH domain